MADMLGLITSQAARSQRQTERCNTYERKKTYSDPYDSDESDLPRVR